MPWHGNDPVGPREGPAVELRVASPADVRRGGDLRVRLARAAREEAHPLHRPDEPSGAKKHV